MLKLLKKFRTPNRQSDNILGQNNRAMQIVGLIIFLLFFLIGAILRANGLAENHSMWHDECALGWNVLNRSYLELLQPLAFSQVAPAFFLIGTKFLVNLLNAQSSAELCDFTMRLIPLGFSLLSLIIFVPFANTILKNKTLTAIAFLIFATNNVIIQYSYEFKQYSADVFFTMAVILIALNSNLSSISYRKLFAYSGIFAISIWLSSSIFFPLLACCIVLLFENFKNKKIYLFLTPLCLSFLLFSIFYFIPNIVQNYQGMSTYWDEGFLNGNALHNFAIIKNALLFFFKPINFILFELFFIIVGLHYFAKNNLKAFIIIGLTILSIIIASLAHYYPISNRLILFLIPIIIVLSVAPLSYVNWRSTKSWVVLAIFTLTFSPSVILFEKNTAKSTAREMMAFLVSNIVPSDKICINDESKIDFRYYSQFHSIENKIVDAELIEGKLKLARGNYWFYLPYNSKNAPTRGKIKKALGKDLAKENLLYVRIK